MDLIFFDLDGTLLNKSSELSTFTLDTLNLLSDKGIAYTVATGRTLLSAQYPIRTHKFALPQIYSNGVTLWDPRNNQISLQNPLSQAEISNIIDVALHHEICPFVNTIEANKHFIFHAPLVHPIEQELVEKYYSRTKVVLKDLSELDTNSLVTNISMIGHKKQIDAMWSVFNSNPHLIAYSGDAHQGEDFKWMDVHHKMANKGSAVASLKTQLNAANVICFGDGDNDLSMFAIADEAYAPANACDEAKTASSAVIGHHDKDGIAHFLRERFYL